MAMRKLSDWFGGLTGPRGATVGAPERQPSSRAGGLLSARRRRNRGSIGVEGLEDRMLLTFGLTSTSSAYVVDTGAQLTFTVSRSNGDLTSIKSKGTELTAPYSQTNRYSHYESGLSSSSTVTATVNAAAGTILV